jgi:poly(3-hydroxybutyrate) depolymerase
MLVIARMLLLVLFAATGFAPAVPREGGIETRAPAANAPALKWFQSDSKGGLHYAWHVPKDYDGKTPCNLTVILHGSNLDWQWGPANNPLATFRPDDIVVSVDGTTPAEGRAHNFLGEKKDADAFAAFLAEMRSLFAVRNVFLYGHSQGSFFVVYFAGEHPDLVTGVVAHASGAWNWSKMTPPVKKVAIAFMHGTKDPVVPYFQSPGSRDEYAKQGFKLLHLRRLQNYNHWPNAVRATECLDWCEGMTTDDPAVALAAARRILTPKKADEYQWITVVGFAGARDVLRRIEGKGPVPFKDVDAKLSTEAADMIKKVEEHAAKHVKALEKQVPSRKELEHGGEWLGHLVALREDFRGVDVVEEYVKKIGYDDELESESKAIKSIWTAWENQKDAKKSFEAIAGSIGSASLYEGFPPELVQKMEEWKKDAKKLGIGKKALEKYADFAAWKTGWEKGSREYESLWNDWKGP